MDAEKEARAFDDPLAGLRSSSYPSTNREKQEREKKQKTEGQYGEKAAENEDLEREEAEARKIRYDNAIKEDRESFRAYATANKIGSDIGQVKLCDEDDTNWAFTRIKCGGTNFRREFR
ncbi:hypothetical protein OROHE_000253 [Orobanche hederae]